MQNDLDSYGCLGAIVAFMFIGTGIQHLDSVPGVICMFIGIIILLASYKITQSLKEQKKQEREKVLEEKIARDKAYYTAYYKEYKRKVSLAIKKHANTLVTKYNQTVYYDDYGNCILDAWQHEIEYFFKNVVFDASHTVTRDDYLYFNEFFEPYLNKLKNNLIVEEIKSGVDYENYCYQKLLNAGFNVRKTNATGDQGVDLIVEENKKKCAIQCKYYNKPVGNKAVQEIIAGQSFYNCEFGIVCSNNTYTKSARQLASSQNIILASENDIVDVLNNLL